MTIPTAPRRGHGGRWAGEVTTVTCPTDDGDFTLDCERNRTLGFQLPSRWWGLQAMICTL